MSKRKTNFKWSYKRAGKRVLTKRAKQYLSEKAIATGKRKRIIKAQMQEAPAPKYKEFVYNVKMSYKSERDGQRDKTHDFATEFKFSWFSDKEPSKKEIQNWLLEHIDKVADNSRIPETIFQIPFNNVEVGLVNIKEALDIAEPIFTAIKYSNKI